MEIFRKKNEATNIVFPMVIIATPELFQTGVSPTDTAYSSDAEAAFGTLAITDTANELGSTGMYEMNLTAAEMNHDLIIIKFTAALGADTAVIIRTRGVDIDDLATPTNITAGTIAVVTTVNGLAAGVIDNTSVGTLDNTNFAFVDANERVDVGAWLGTAATSGTGGPDVNVNAIGDSTLAATQLALSAAEIESGICEGTPSVTNITTDLAETQDDIYIGRTIIMTSGNARGEMTDITDYVGSTGELIVTALANAPAVSDTFILI